MVRRIIQLTEDQAQSLTERAKEQGTSVSELVRQGVDLILRTGITNNEMRKRAIEAIGFIKDTDARDLSVNHDKYLAEAYGNESSG